MTKAQIFSGPLFFCRGGERWIDFSTTLPRPSGRFSTTQTARKNASLACSFIARAKFQGLDLHLSTAELDTIRTRVSPKAPRCSTLAQFSNSPKRSPIGVGHTRGHRGLLCAGLYRGASKRAQSQSGLPPPH